MFELNNLKAELQAKDTTIVKLKENIKRLNKTSTTNSVKKDIDEIETINIELEHRSVEISDLNAQLQEKVFVITTLKIDLRKLKGKDIVDNAAQVSNATTIAPGMFKIDPVILAPRDKNNRETHIYYLKHTMEQAAILREIVEQAKSLNPLDNASYTACKYVKLIQELLGYIRDTCPDILKPSDKLITVTPKNNVKKVRFFEPLTSSNNTQHVESSKTSDSNIHVLSSTRVKCSTSTCRSQPTSNKRNDRILQPSSSNIKNTVEAQPRKVDKKNRVVETICNANVKQTMLNANSQLICVTPGDADREVPVNETFHEKTDDKLTEKELKQLEADEFTSTNRESIESYYHRFSKLMNDFKRNKHFPEKIASNLKFLNNLQPEWSRHVTIVHQTKDLHIADYTQLYDFLKYNQKEVDDLRADRLAKTLVSLALMANSNNPFQLFSVSPRSTIIKQMQMVRGNGGNQVRQYAGQNVRNQNGVEHNGGTVEQHSTTVEETSAYSESLYNNLAIEVEKEAAKFVRDFKSLANEADESFAKYKALEFEIERLLKAVFSQDIMSIVQNPTVVETSDLLTELEHTLDPLSQKLENENVELEFQLRAQLFDKVSGQKDITKGTCANTKFTKQLILGKPPTSSKSKLYSVTPFPNSKVILKVGESNALLKPSHFKLGTFHSRIK
ncbi:hypothetical protein Tco_0099783, partial [Tanacetum coccineum]